MLMDRFLFVVTLQYPVDFLSLWLEGLGYWILSKVIQVVEGNKEGGDR